MLADQVEDKVRADEDDWNTPHKGSGLFPDMSSKKKNRNKKKKGKKNAHNDDDDLDDSPFGSGNRGKKGRKPAREREALFKPPENRQEVTDQKFLHTNTREDHSCVL